MTVTSETSKYSYSGDGATTSFAYSSYFLADTDLLVTKRSVAGVETTLTLGIGYTVTGAGNPSGGNVIVTPAPASGERLTLSRKLALTQGLSLPNTGLFPAPSLEARLDALTMMCQQLQEQINRSITLNITSTAVKPVLGDPAANATLAYNATADGIIAGATQDQITNAQTYSTTAATQAGIATTQAGIAATQAAAAAASAASLAVYWAGTAGGTANAVTLTPSPAIAANAAGQEFDFVVNTVNTSGTVTASVSGKTALPIQKSMGGALVALGIGDLPAGTIAKIRNIDGANFQLMNIRPFSQSADIASAGTLNLDTATGLYTNITGTTAITAVTLAQGQMRIVKFAGILTLTNGANLILPTGANITTAAGDVAFVMGEASGIARVLGYFKASGAALTGGGTAPMIGAFRNLKSSVLAASASATFTADEIIVETALGGTAYKLSAYSQTVNLGTTGAGGMDTGSAPANGFVSIYAIAKADGTTSILACNATTSTSSVYAGGNMPAGYVASCLISTWRTNGSSQFVTGAQLDRKIWTGTFVNVLDVAGGSAATSLTSLSLSGAVPTNARVVYGSIGQKDNNYFAVTLASDSGGVVSRPTMAAAANSTYVVDGFYASAVPFDLPILTAQTIWYKAAVAANTVHINVYAYDI